MIKTIGYSCLFKICVLCLIKPANTRSALFFSSGRWINSLNSLDFADGTWMVHPTCPPACGFFHKLEAGFILLLGFNKSGSQVFSSFSLPDPEGRGPPSKVQIQPFGAPPPFRASVFSYQLVPTPETPTLLSLPTKWLLGLQDPIRKSKVTHQVCDIFIGLLGRLRRRVPIVFSVLSVTALATPYHVYRNSGLFPAPSFPTTSLLLSSDHSIWVGAGVGNVLPSHLVGNTWFLSLPLLHGPQRVLP